MNLFDSPPLEMLTRKQKVGRAFLVTGSLVVICILSAMALAGGIFVVQRFHRIIKALVENDFAQAMKMGEIVLLSITVNLFCIWILFQIRRLDRNLMANP